MLDLWCWSCEPGHTSMNILDWLNQLLWERLLQCSLLIPDNSCQRHLCLFSFNQSQVNVPGLASDGSYSFIYSTAHLHIWLSDRTCESMIYRITTKEIDAIISTGCSPPYTTLEKSNEDDEKLLRILMIPWGILLLNRTETCSQYHSQLFEDIYISRKKKKNYRKQTCLVI